jgi:hypothetical protein
MLDRLGQGLVTFDKRPVCGPRIVLCGIGAGSKRTPESDLEDRPAPLTTDLLPAARRGQAGMERDRRYAPNWPNPSQTETNSKAFVSKGKAAGSAGQATPVIGSMVGGRVSQSTSANGERTMRHLLVKLPPDAASQPFSSPLRRRTDVSRSNATAPGDASAVSIGLKCASEQAAVDRPETPGGVAGMARRSSRRAVRRNR